MKCRNIVITGVGGQGILTLGRVIGRAALYEGLEARVAEIHGLAQRGGSLIVHVRYGEKVFSPTIPKFGADIMISLEAIEALRYCEYISPHGFVILNKYIHPPYGHEKIMTFSTVINYLRSLFPNLVVKIVDGTFVAKKLGDVRVTNIVILGYVYGLNLLDLSKSSIIRAIKETIPQKYITINLKAFDEGMKLTSINY